MDPTKQERNIKRYEHRDINKNIEKYGERYRDKFIKRYRERHQITRGREI